VQRVAGRYLQTTNRVVVHTLPATAPAAAPPAPVAK